jgi:hypothetical protein
MMLQRLSILSVSTLLHYNLDNNLLNRYNLMQMYAQPSTSGYPYYGTSQSSQFRADSSTFPGVSSSSLGTSTSAVSSTSNPIDFSVRSGYAMPSLFNSGLPSLSSASTHNLAASTCANYGQSQNGLFGSGNWLSFVPYGSMASAAGFMSQDGTSTSHLKAGLFE